jgi:hypothetical protein
MTTLFMGTDYAEIILAINGKIDDEIDNEIIVRELIKEENIPVLREFLASHIIHNEKCENGRTEDNGVFKELLKIEDEFTFLNIFYALVPLMWC